MMAPFRDRMPGAAAWSLACLLTATGSLHFIDAPGFESIVPRFLGWPGFWVATSGVAEMICVGFLPVRRTRKAAGFACVVLFIVVFPANIAAAVNSLHGDGSVLLDWLRLPLQIPLILWALYVARHAGGDARVDDASRIPTESVSDPIERETY